MALLRAKDKDGNYIDIPALNGESAYNIAVKNGFVGTEAEWLESLKGEEGVSPDVTVTQWGTHGYIVKIKDADGEQIFTVYNGSDGAKGSDGADGISPKVVVTETTTGHNVQIYDAEGAKTFLVPNGKDGTSKVTLHSKYYTNDSVNGIMDSGLGSYDVFIETANPLPNNAVIYDVGIWYESDSLPLKEYRGIELYTTELISPMGFLEINSSASLDGSYYGGYSVARLVDENAGTLLSSIKMYDGCTKGFTVYYMVGDEVVEDE